MGMNSFQPELSDPAENLPREEFLGQSIQQQSTSKIQRSVSLMPTPSGEKEKTNARSRFEFTSPVSIAYFNKFYLL